VSVIDILVFAGALAGIVAMVCRIDQVRWWTHSVLMVAMHCAMAIACGAAAAHAWDGTTTLVDGATVTATLCWVAYSLRDWSSASASPARLGVLTFPPAVATKVLHHAPETRK
jgi:hypothetical protein